jgi:multiple sugar transport system ATP-binding protein
MLEITELLGKKPRELSGGQRQRVAVGRALIRNPRAFLLDEPLSNLDALLRERVRHELRELFRKVQATVIYVTHDQIEAMTLADRVVVLDRGRLQQIGTPEELYQRPANRFVASFIGSPSMSFFEVDLDDGSFTLDERRYDTGVRLSQRVTVGIRPEALQIGPGVKGRVRWVETLGAHFLAGVQVGDKSMTALLRTKPAGETIDLSVDVDQIHVFDTTSGKNLRFAAA